MRPTRTIAVLSCMSILLGCAAERSNTQKVSGERATIFFVDGKECFGVQQKPESLSALVISTIDSGMKLLIDGAKWVIERDSKQYEATWTTKRHIRISGLSLLQGGRNDFGTNWRISTSGGSDTGIGGGVFVVIRSVEADAKNDDKRTRELHRLGQDPEKEDLFLEQTRSLLCALNTGKVIPFEIDVESVIQNLRIHISKLYDDQKNSALTFAAVGILMPYAYASASESDNGFGVSDQSMQILLAGYLYPALKAKRSSISVPFTDWDEIKSIMTVRLQGPLGRSNSGSAGYDVSCAFPVIPEYLHDVKSQAVNRWFRYTDGSPKEQAKQWSPLLSIPPGNDLTMSVTLVESSKLADRIEELADAIGGIEVSAKDLGIGKD